MVRKVPGLVCLGDKVEENILLDSVGPSTVLRNSHKVVPSVHPLSQSQLLTHPSFLHGGREHPTITEGTVYPKDSVESETTNV